MAAKKKPVKPFEEQVAEAKASGKPFRVEHSLSKGHSLVIYLTKKEIAESKQRTKNEVAERKARESKPVLQRLAEMIGTDVATLKRELRK